MKIVERCRKFLALSGKEKAWFLKAWFALPVTMLGLRLFGLKRFQDMLGRISRSSENANAAEIEFLTKRLAGLITNAANTSLVHATCLPRSLTLWWLLRREGIESELHFGMQKENEQIKGHAWIERQGKVLNDDSDVSDRYLRMGNL